MQSRGADTKSWWKSWLTCCYQRCGGRFAIVLSRTRKESVATFSNINKTSPTACVGGGTSSASAVHCACVGEGDGGSGVWLWGARTLSPTPPLTVDVPYYESGHN